MASRSNEAALRSGLRPPRANLSRGQRLIFVFALVTFGLASVYSSLSLTRRIWPALFPGHDIPFSDVIDNLTLPGPVSIAAPDANPFNHRINLLIMGLDRRPQDPELDSWRTDTLMVATIDPLAKQMSVLSLPRDMLVDIHVPGQQPYEDRINDSWGVGIQNGHTFEAGAAQLETDLQDNFGISIDYWVLLDFKGVEKLIDALDGIDINIPQELALGAWYYTDDDVTNPHFVAFPPGPQHLDGYNAVAFGRFRNDSDLYRVKRQQLVMQTALQKVFARGLLNNPLDLWDAYSSTVKTDIPRAKMPGYALLLKETNGRMNMFSLGDPVNGVPTLEGYTTPAGASVLLWDPQNVQYWLSQVFTNAAYSASTVEVQDAFGTNDGSTEATALGRYLAYSKGLPTVYLGPQLSAQPDTSVTLYTDNMRPLAEDIAKWLNIPATAIKSGTKVEPSDPDVVIVVGQNFKLPGT
jgi:LCP family protein required for cell wall assembly